ncbi:hypothetical protein [Pseudorhodoferax aquiterrae]|uniref:hypothetical protein n=1 Tax=Pseudorhodoferax aquiterrae TaxID=747304 RepID=UPI001677C072|nr:hypothetical protein [Pseudorhodoferax aquiterrae]
MAVVLVMRPALSQAGDFLQRIGGAGREPPAQQVRRERGVAIGGDGLHACGIGRAGDRQRQALGGVGVAGHLAARFSKGDEVSVGIGNADAARTAGGIDHAARDVGQRRRAAQAYRDLGGSLPVKAMLMCTPRGIGRLTLPAALKFSRALLAAS